MNYFKGYKKDVTRIPEDEAQLIEILTLLEVVLAQWGKPFNSWFALWHFPIYMRKRNKNNAPDIRLGYFTLNSDAEVRASRTVMSDRLMASHALRLLNAGKMTPLEYCLVAINDLEAFDELAYMLTGKRRRRKSI